MTPGTAQTAAQGKSIQYSVSGLDNGTDYAVDLFNCDNVSTDANGQVSFVQTTQPTSTQAGSGVADEGARGNNGISVVNGVATAQSSSYPKSATVKPSNGTITFTVSNTDTSAPESCVVPVVYQDANQSGTLNVDKTSGQPTEAFGDGGSATFTPPAATSGTYTVTQVLSVDKSAGTFVGTTAGGTYSFSYTTAGDNYTYSNTPNPTRLSESQFADYLSAKMANAGANDGTVNGDALTVNYNASGPSDFTYNTDVPAAPTGTKATFEAAVTSGPAAGKHAADRVTVTWTAPSNPDVTAYKVYRVDVDKDGKVGAFGVPAVVTASTPADSTTSTSGGTTYYDTTVQPGHTYAYEVSAVGDTAEGPVSNQNQATDPAASQPGAVAGAPTITDVRAQDGGTAFQLGQGDIIQMAFNEPMKSTALDGASFRVSDGVNSGTITIGGANSNATYAWLPAGTYNGVTVRADQAAQIVLTGALNNQSPSTGSVSYPAKITNVTSGVQDADEGLTRSLASGDTTINTDQPFTVVDTTAPTESNPTATVAGTIAGGNAMVNGAVTASDNVAVTAVKATLQDGTGAAVATADATYDGVSGTWKVSFPVTTAGSYTVQYVAKDAAGNTSTPATSTAATVS